ncbi:tautomerase family protein [Klebsiella variicola subsp. variicola]|nr:tautomerase family protein [Klebsiella variicola subsp. variicola]
MLTFDIIEGRSATEIRTMLDAAHRAVLTAFNVPERDRYQIVHENKNYQMVFQDTGLVFERSDRLVMVRVFTSPRSEEQKNAFHGGTGTGTGRTLWGGRERFDDQLYYQCAG